MKNLFLNNSDILLGFITQLFPNLIITRNPMISLICSKCMYSFRINKQFVHINSPSYRPESIEDAAGIIK